MATQLFGAAYFYQERMSFLDAPFILFKIIQDKSLAIMVDRYGSFITQIFPLMGLKLDASLKMLMILYSLSFPIFTLLVGLILYRWKQDNILIGMASYFLLFYSDAFFWTNNEVHQGIVWFSLSWGLYNLSKRFERFRVAYILSFLLLGLSIFTHPLVMVVALYVGGWYLISRRWSLYKPSTWITVAVIIFWLLAKYIASTYNWYDSQKFNLLSNWSLDDLISGKDKPLWGLFFKNLVTYYLTAAAFFVTGIFYLMKGRIYVLLYMLTFILLYVFMVSLVVPEFDRFYTESQWMLIACLLVWPIVHEVAEGKSIKSSWLFLLFIIATFHWGARMIPSANTFQKRLAWHQSQIDNWRSTNQQKVIFDDLSEETRSLLQMSWGLPVESLLLSSLNSNLPSVTYIDRNHVLHENDSTYFHNCFDTLSIDDLNPRYFKLYKDQFYHHHSD